MRDVPWGLTRRDSHMHNMKITLMHSNRSAVSLLSDTILLLVEICESDLRATRYTTTNCTTNDIHTPLTRDIVSNT